jgi:hypothetical protein
LAADLIAFAERLLLKCAAVSVWTIDAPLKLKVINLIFFQLENFYAV